MANELNQTTEKLHKCQLLLASELKRLCEKHNIKYYMIAGTLLGAVRHKGFIPWDDDMDFAIMRCDYARFLKVCKAELGEDFVLQEMFIDKNYALPMAKLLLKGTVLAEYTTVNNKALKGIYIDVFPFDSIPDSEALRKKHSRKIYILKYLFLAKQSYKFPKKGEYKKSLIYALLKFATFFVTKSFLRNSLENELCRFKNEKTKKVAAIGGAYPYSKESVERQWFEESVELDFENIKLSAPKDYTEYLTYFYGDYMTPPPEDKRENRHNVVKLDFGKYNF